MIGSGKKLSGGANVGDLSHLNTCAGWLAAARNAVQLVCPNLTDPYRLQTDHLCTILQLTRNDLPVRVGDFCAVLVQLLADIDSGLLITVTNRARAEVFDDFLDHAEEYLQQDRKNEAGVIAGIVFEDTIRRVCRLRQISERGVNLDRLFSEMVKQNIMTNIQAKRARSAAALRTAAAHARWNDFEQTDVPPTIDFTRELLASHLGG